MARYCRRSEASNGATPAAAGGVALGVGALTRPKAGVADFYRELGHLFGVALSPHNRWAGAKALRDTWLAHIDAAVFRPVLLLDEAQDVRLDVLNELRLLASADLDARVILTVVLAGDRRLQDRLRARGERGAGGWGP